MTCILSFCFQLKEKQRYRRLLQEIIVSRQVFDHIKAFNWPPETVALVNCLAQLKLGVLFIPGMAERLDHSTLDQRVPGSKRPSDLS